MEPKSKQSISEIIKHIIMFAIFLVPGFYFHMFLPVGLIRYSNLGVIDYFTSKNVPLWVRFVAIVVTILVLIMGTWLFLGLGCAVSIGACR
jgi:protein-S-isoprenylcysteine O-methyltransferase Ste14